MAGVASTNASLACSIVRIAASASALLCTGQASPQPASHDLRVTKHSTLLELLRAVAHSSACYRRCRLSAGRMSPAVDPCSRASGLHRHLGRGAHGTAEPQLRQRQDVVLQCDMKQSGRFRRGIRDGRPRLALDCPRPEGVPLRGQLYHACQELCKGCEGRRSGAVVSWRTVRSLPSFLGKLLRMKVSHSDTEDKQPAGTSPRLPWTPPSGGATGSAWSRKRTREGGRRDSLRALGIPDAPSMDTRWPASLSCNHSLSHTPTRSQIPRTHCESPQDREASTTGCPTWHRRGVSRRANGRMHSYRSP